jgi:hypothetical protein
MNTGTLDLARQQLLSQAQNGQVTLDQALNTTIAGTKISDLPDVKGALTGLAVDGKLDLETVLTCVNSRYEVSGGDLVPKGSGNPLDVKGLDLSGLSGLAELMLLMLRNAAEQRKTGQEIRMAQSEAIEQKLMDAAADMRAGAITAMVMGVVSGAVSIAGGIASLGAIGGGVKAAANNDPAVSGFSNSDIMTAASGNAQAYGSIAGGASGIIGSIGQGVQGILNAEVKEKEAEAEKMRASRDQEGDIINGVKDFIQTTIQLMQTMLDKENDTLTRVMA